MCPVCGGYATLLGRLGLRFWFRCRSCGYDWSETRSQEWDDEAEE